MLYDFSANDTVDTLDVVPEIARPLYVQKDGKYVLAEATKPFALAYVGESKTLDTTRKDLKKAQAESASRRVTGTALVDFLKGRGVETIDEENPITTIDAYVTDLLDKSKKGGEINVNMAKVKAESDRRVAEVQAAADGKVGKMQGTLQRYLVNQQATAALAKAGGNVDLLLDKVIKAAKVVQEGEDFVVRIVDDAGEVRSNGAGGYMDFEGYVAELKTKPVYQPAFKSEVGSGTGHQPGGSKQVPKKIENGTKTPNQKIAAGLAAAEKSNGRVSV